MAKPKSIVGAFLLLSSIYFCSAPYCLLAQAGRYVVFDQEFNNDSYILRPARPNGSSMVLKIAVPIKWKKNPETQLRPEYNQTERFIILHALDAIFEEISARSIGSLDQIEKDYKFQKRALNDRMASDAFISTNIQSAEDVVYALTHQIEDHSQAAIAASFCDFVQDRRIIELSEDEGIIERGRFRSLEADGSERVLRLESQDFEQDLRDQLNLASRVRPYTPRFRFDEDQIERMRFLLEPYRSTSFPGYEHEARPIDRLGKIRYFTAHVEGTQDVLSLETSPPSANPPEGYHQNVFQLYAAHLMLLNAWSENLLMDIQNGDSLDGDVIEEIVLQAFSARSLSEQSLAISQISKVMPSLAVKASSLFRENLSTESLTSLKIEKEIALEIGLPQAVAVIRQEIRRRESESLAALRLQVDSQKDAVGTWSKREIKEMTDGRTSFLRELILLDQTFDAKLFDELVIDSETIDDRLALLKIAGDVGFIDSVQLEPLLEKIRLDFKVLRASVRLSGSTIEFTEKQWAEVNEQVDPRILELNKFVLSSLSQDSTSIDENSLAGQAKWYSQLSRSHSEYLRRLAGWSAFRDRNVVVRTQTLSRLAEHALDSRSDSHLAISILEQIAIFPSDDLELVAIANIIAPIIQKISNSDMSQMMEVSRWLSDAKAEGLAPFETRLQDIILNKKNEYSEESQARVQALIVSLHEANQYARKVGTSNAP